MKRLLSKLSNNTYDLLIIGGGIIGSSIAWNASLHGLSVALIDKADFGAATSANSQKIIHGGLRYLQNLDLPRIRQSIHERKRLMWLAPHLVHPLACIMPIYGHGFKGKEVMWLGLRLYDLIAKNRNVLPDPEKFIQMGKMLSVAEINRLIPGLEQKSLKGAAQWSDAICWNTERMVLSFIKSAYKMGATVANYVKAETVHKNKDALFVVTSEDKLSGQTFDILAKKVINCTGPWINHSLRRFQVTPSKPKIKFAVGLNIITDNIFCHQMAVGLGKPIENKSRLYFIVPWRGKSIIGTEWFRYDGHPDRFEINEWQCAKLIAGFNSVYPFVKLTVKDILHVHGGLVPCKLKEEDLDEGIPIIKHFKIIDHVQDGMAGMVSILGVKYTTAVDVAEKVLSYIFPSIKAIPLFSQPKLIGGEIENFSSYRLSIIDKWKDKIEESDLKRLILNYGSEVEQILKIAMNETFSYPGQTNVSMDIIKGETLFAIKNELAQKLLDVIMRRTDRGTAGNLRESDLTKMSFMMAKELGWNEAQRKAEKNEVLTSYPHFIKNNSRVFHDHPKQEVRNSAVFQSDLWHER